MIKLIYICVTRDLPASQIHIKKHGPLASSSDSNFVISNQFLSLFTSYMILHCVFIVSAGKHLSNIHLSDLSIVGTRDIFVYR